MLKRLTALLLTLVLLTCSFSLAETAEGLDLSSLESESAFTFTVQEEDQLAFIDMDDYFTYAAYSFTHKYEHDKKYSALYSDIIIVDYGTDDAYPILRTWIDYAGTRFITADSATFRLGNKAYTLSGLSSTDRVTEDEDGVYETLLIKYDIDNVDFLMALYDYYLAHKDEEGDVTVPFVLHGSTEDIEVVMSENSVINALMLLSKFTEINGIGYMNQVNRPATLTVEDITD